VEPLLGSSQVEALNSEYGQYLVALWHQVPPRLARCGLLLGLPVHGWVRPIWTRHCTSFDIWNF
jgi:hypothetical protein